jgi:hypothetical protein
MNRDLFQWGHVVPVLPAGWLTGSRMRKGRHVTSPSAISFFFRNKSPTLQVYSIGRHFIHWEFEWKKNSPVKKKNEKCELVDANLLIFGRKGPQVDRPNLMSR